MRLGLGDSQFDISILPERQINAQWDGAWDGRTKLLKRDGAPNFMPWSVMPLPQTEGDRKIDWFIRDLAQEECSGDLLHYR